MAKRISEEERNVIIKGFLIGKTINELSRIFNYTKLTITRNIKKILGEDKYQQLIKSNSEKILLNKQYSEESKEFDYKSNEIKDINLRKETDSQEESFSLSSFIEIAPLNQEIDNVPQKDLSSIPISEITFPKTVYMIVNKNTELETKALKNYPEWEFLPKDDLNRETIQIYSDLKVAKRECSKEQKVIKVPNTNVFKIAAPLLVSRGISRLISDEKLIAL